MDSETTMHLWALREINIAMLDGLKLALVTMQSWDSLAQDRKDSIIDSLQELVARTEMVYSKHEQKH